MASETILLNSYAKAWARENLNYATSLNIPAVIGTAAALCMHYNDQESVKPSEVMGHLTAYPISSGLNTVGETELRGICDQVIAYTERKTLSVGTFGNLLRESITKDRLNLFLPTSPEDVLNSLEWVSPHWEKRRKIMTDFSYLCRDQGNGAFNAENAKRMINNSVHGSDGAKAIHYFGLMAYASRHKTISLRTTPELYELANQRIQEQDKAVRTFGRTCGAAVVLMIGAVGYMSGCFNENKEQTEKQPIVTANTNDKPVTTNKGLHYKR